MPRATLLLATLLPLACGPTSGTSDASSGAATTTADPTTTTTADPTTSTSTSTPTTTDDPAPTTASTASSDDTASTADPGPPTLCAGTSSSDLPGVSIVFPPQPCRFTLAEAAAGLHFIFEVTIDAPVDAVTSLHNDQGSCDQPGPSGLITFGQVSDGFYHYCLCDVGLCGGEVESVTLAPGSFPDTFTWYGFVWGGPHDVFEPEGPPFPPGDYTVTVSSHGELGPDAQPFELLASLPITLVP